MAVADNRQRYMPQPEDRLPSRCQTLGYPEAVLLVNPMRQELRGEVLINPPHKLKERERERERERNSHSIDRPVLTYSRYYLD